MTGLKISKFGKYSDLNIIYELENDDFIVNHLLTLDDSWPNTKINIWYYLDIKSERRDIFIYFLNNSWLILDMDLPDFENRRLLSIDSIDVETIKNGVLYLIDRYKKYLSWEKIDNDKQEKDIEIEKQNKNLENENIIINLKSEIKGIKISPSIIKATWIDEDKWALWLRKLDNIYIELEVYDIDLDKNFIKVSFNDSYIKESLLIEWSILENWKLDKNVFIESIKNHISLLVKNMIKY